MAYVYNRCQHLKHDRIKLPNQKYVGSAKRLPIVVTN